ncbi:MAG: DNA polymerase III subunit gamma/tau [bacterium]|nr:DNA polymerase III subunit gamma/tau [bacterium]
MRKAVEYQVLARKWRPQQFADVVGQEHVTTTIANAIERGRVAHAYLFTGPRGIGKTSTARIFAKALNCEKGPSPRPCDRCPSCEGILCGGSMDVIEIDGASNRGIEEIRTLRENVKFAASAGRYKVYIIDEVHQITADAFNALLKTLEEPPPHVKFLFATTEPHRVPATILSRCQRFDLRAISPREIVGRLGRIAKAEKIAVEDDALYAIARYAQGSMRDAESILDQLSSFCEGDIGEEEVVSMLGLVRESALRDMTGALIAGDCRKGLETIAAVAGEGKDLSLFLSDWIGSLRSVMLALVLGEGENSAGVSAQAWEDAAAAAKALTLEQVRAVIETLMQAEGQMRRSLSPRVAIETAFLKAVAMRDAASVAEILEKIRALEARLGGGEGEARGGEEPPPAPPRGPGGRRAEPPRGKPWGGGERPADLLEARHRGGRPTDAPRERLSAADPAGDDRPPPTREEEEEILGRIRAGWGEIVERVSAASPILRPYLIEGVPGGLEGGTLTIAFPAEGIHHRDFLEQPRRKALVRKIVSECAGRGVGVRFDLAAKAPAAGPPAGGAAREPVARREVQTLKRNPVIQEAIEMFQAQVVEVKK